MIDHNGHISSSHIRSFSLIHLRMMGVKQFVSTGRKGRCAPPHTNGVVDDRAQHCRIRLDRLTLTLTDLDHDLGYIYVHGRKNNTYSTLYGMEKTWVSYSHFRCCYITTPFGGLHNDLVYDFLGFGTGVGCGDAAVAAAAFFGDFMDGVRVVHVQHFWSNTKRIPTFRS